VRLRNPQNQPLELASLFVYTKQQVERVPPQAPSMLTGAAGAGGGASLTATAISNSGSGGGGGLSATASFLDLKQHGKHKQFKLTIYGLNGEDDESGGVTIMATQETTALQAIEQALQKASNKEPPLKEPGQFLLVQEVERRWSNSHSSAINASLLLDVLSRSRRDASAASSSSHHHQRTKSLCVNNNNNNGINYILSKKEKGAAKKQQHYDRSGSSSKAIGKEKALDTRVLLNQERILEAQNKWTGNGRFIIKDKAAYGVICIIYYIFLNMQHDV
jgi:hypothetical protein